MGYGRRSLRAFQDRADLCVEVCWDVHGCAARCHRSSRFDEIVRSPSAKKCALLKRAEVWAFGTGFWEPKRKSQPKIEKILFAKIGADVM